MRCPKCGSNNVIKVKETNSTEFDATNACCGYIIWGPVGLLCGLCGNNETERNYYKCDDCGLEFK